MMQTQFESMDEDIGGRKEKDAHDRTGGRAEAVCFVQTGPLPFGTLETTPWHPIRPRGVHNASLSDGNAAIVTTARLPASRSPMARADQLAHIVRLPLAPPAAQYKAVANHFTALGKRQHRSRYQQRSRDASDGRAVRFAVGVGAGCESEPHARPGAGGSADSGLAGGRACQAGSTCASSCIRSRTRCALREGWMRIWLMRCRDARRGGAFMRPVQAGRPTVWRAL